MKMFIAFVFLCSVSVLFFSCGTPQSGGELTITTSSVEARELFLQGRDKYDNVEFAVARELFDQAIAKDPNFAMAYLYRTLNTGDLDESRKFLGKALALLEQITPGESEFILYYQAIFDGDGPQQKVHLEKLQQLLPNDPHVLYEFGILKGNLIVVSKITFLYLTSIIVFLFLSTALISKPVGNKLLFTSE